jgi:hypothetical protein
VLLFSASLPDCFIHYLTEIVKKLKAVSPKDLDAFAVANEQFIRERNGITQAVHAVRVLNNPVGGSTYCFLCRLSNPTWLYGKRLVVCATPAFISLYSTVRSVLFCAGEH